MSLNVFAHFQAPGKRSDYEQHEKTKKHKLCCPLGSDAGMFSLHL